MDAGTICAFDFHINGGRGGSCADFIKGGLDSHNGRCERGHHVAIRAADIAFFRSPIKRHRNNLVIIKRENFIFRPHFESRLVD